MKGIRDYKLRQKAEGRRGRILFCQGTEAQREIV